MLDKSIVKSDRNDHRSDQLEQPSTAIVPRAAAEMHTQRCTLTGRFDGTNKTAVFQARLLGGAETLQEVASAARASTRAPLRNRFPMTRIGREGKSVCFVLSQAILVVHDVRKICQKMSGLLSGPT